MPLSASAGCRVMATSRPLCTPIPDTVARLRSVVCVPLARLAMPRHPPYRPRPLVAAPMAAPGLFDFRLNPDPFLVVLPPGSAGPDSVAPAPSVKRRLPQERVLTKSRFLSGCYRREMSEIESVTAI